MFATERNNKKGLGLATKRQFRVYFLTNTPTNLSRSRKHIHTKNGSQNQTPCIYKLSVTVCENPSEYSGFLVSIHKVQGSNLGRQSFRGYFMVFRIPSRQIRHSKCRLLPRWYRHLDSGIFSRVTGLACTSELHSNAGGILAAGQVLGQVSDKAWHSGPPGWGLGARLLPSPHKNLDKGGSNCLNMDQRATEGEE